MKTSKKKSETVESLTTKGFARKMEAVRAKHEPLLVAAIQKDNDARQLVTALRKFNHVPPYLVGTYKVEHTGRTFQQVAYDALMEDAMPVLNEYLGLSPVSFRPV